ncbi:MAG: hypothetical protein ACOYO1_16525 [Bacteroidales bacterium]
MKKSNVFLVAVLIGLLATSCVKESENIVNTKGEKFDKTSTALLIKQFKSISFGGTYLLKSHVGHKSSECGGKCTFACGKWVHVDCQGSGSYCVYSASVDITKNIPADSSDIYYTGVGLNDYEPTDDSTFQMPARSFYFENEKYENGYIWINIPEQQLQRDEETNLFMYKNITFTENALFENL